ncbi:MAG: alpha/beta fold hydrolase [Leuconostoc mesenteroides]|uniref:alpha/beta fold hydrolase n=1 Tax=Leuconostoc mesenteroides TaxID=1245 RepID=UPI000A05D391|nr:alpha/beta hydrolase [Leuconostoc mesenteroides]MCP9301580.1 alpha/beta hydrolase [Leuconostoc mesenteroides]MCP9326034.1 alpha/beta hydrolase [Leuconostoc mesenteroides]ORI81448.1 alpha/beta hydrolase [Leuconostoc mesenteroides subsp. mesenteroides]
MSTFITNDDVKLNYNIYGDGQPIILVAGYSGNQATWAAQIEPLKQAGFQVITYDRRNHGESQTVDYGMRMSRHGQDLAELIAALHLNQVIFVGHSMGASTIWSYLSLYGEADVKAIITEDQIPKILRDETWSLGIFNADITMIWTAAEKLPHTKLTHAKISSDIKRKLAAAYHPFNFKYNELLLVNSFIEDWRDIVKRERVPHLFLAGKHSPLWPADHVYDLKDMSTFGEEHIFEEAGHIPHIEEPENFNQVTINFLKRIDDY